MKNLNNISIWWSYEKHCLGLLCSLWFQPDKSLEYFFFFLQAETWLNEQAQEMGWAKATKLAGRNASQGLVAVKFDTNHGTLVELNCETDFVAKNEKFHKLIQDATSACFKLAHSSLQSKGPVTKVYLLEES